MKHLTWLALGIVSFLAVAGSDVVLEKRELTVRNYPCMKCHGDIKNDAPRFPLSTPHHLLKFDHMDTVKNCFQCHDKENRDILVLQSGEKISFNESYRQCFQCHGEKKRDWELGIHGKAIGSWSGTKYKQVCSSCHEPHHPQFRLMRADPGPVHPNAAGGH